MTVELGGVRGVGRRLWGVVGVWGVLGVVGGWLRAGVGEFAAAWGRVVGFLLSVALLFAVLFSC